jgi:hypothetical protein
MERSHAEEKEITVMKRLLLMAALVTVLSLVTTSAALADNGDGENNVTTGEVAMLLAPVVAAALAVERILEMIFGFIESAVLSAGRFLGLGGEYVQWAQGAAAEYRSSLESLHADLKQAGDTVRQKMTDLSDAKERGESDDVVRRLQGELNEAKEGAQARQTAFDKADDALQDVEQRLKNFVKSPFWISRKKALSVLIGIGLGLAVAIVGQIRMFNMLGVDLAEGITVPSLEGLLRWSDILITGFVIGTGSKFVHQLIGILQETKDTITDAGNLWRGTAGLRLSPGEAGAAAPPAAPPAHKAVLEVDENGLPIQPPSPPSRPEAGIARERRRIERLLR